MFKKNMTNITISGDSIAGGIFDAIFSYVYGPEIPLAYSKLSTAQLYDHCQKQFITSKMLLELKQQTSQNSTINSTNHTELFLVFFFCVCVRIFFDDFFNDIFKSVYVEKVV